MKKLAFSIMGFSIIGSVLAGTCYQYYFAGLDVIPGQYNGCTACTSDNPASDDSCSGVVPPGGSGMACDLQPQSYSYYTRHKNYFLGVCYSCSENSTTGSVLRNTAPSGTECAVDERGRERWIIKTKPIIE